MRKFDHINAESYEEASSALRSYKKAEPIAGGTDLIGTLKKQILPDAPEAVVNLKTIKDASYIRDRGKSSLGRSEKHRLPDYQKRSDHRRKYLPGCALLVLPLSPCHRRTSDVREKRRG